MAVAIGTCIGNELGAGRLWMKAMCLGLGLKCHHGPTHRQLRIGKMGGLRMDVVYRISNFHM